MTEAARPPRNLRVEHVDAPLGLTVPRPRLSWQLPDGTRAQVGYQIRAGAWDSGRVESDRSLLVPYGGPELRSGERVRWTVRAWTPAGVTTWAEPSWWEMGLLGADDWTARWIEPVMPDEPAGRRPRSPRPAHLLRHSFAVDRPVSRARLYATAHGIYELFVNGRRVGDMELTPGYTSYSSNLHVQTFDVTGLLRPGENHLGAVLSDGWFRGQNGGYRLADVYGNSVALLAQLDVTYADGSSVSVGTGPEWLCSTGAIQEADLMQGQVVDLRREPANWAPVEVREHDFSRLHSSAAPPVRRVEELRPVSVSRLPSGRQIVDLGQNINGWVRLTSLGPGSARLTLTYGETLDRNGDVTLDNLVVDVSGQPTYEQPALANFAAPLQVDGVISAGQPGEVFEPRHTTHGFRYVRVEGHPDDLTPDDVTGVVVHTDLRRTGWFECSDERLNKLHEAAVWSFRGNAVDIPTDCPTRERAGWTGDWQLFVPTAAFLYDVAGFTTKWLRDLAAEQQDDGLVLDCVPSALSLERAVELNIANRSSGWWPGSAGWGDAAVIVPWEIYRAYGDTRLLEQQWESMVAWVDYAARAAREHRHPSRVAARPTPSAHEQFLWDTGFHYGEWLEPGVSDLAEIGANIADLAAADQGDVATAYLHLSSRLLSKIARVLGRDDDAVRYDRLAAATRAAWLAEFVRPDGTLTRNTQAAHVQALAFDLVPDELRPRLARRLVDLVRAAVTHLGTGFLATPYLLPVLADTGHLDVAYELLLQDSEPSWLTMIDRGATTIWEAWNGIDEDGRANLSLNHYSKGAVISFLHRYVGGIRLLDNPPAYRRFVVDPVVGGGLTWARTVHDSPYGRIESSWRLDGAQLTLDIAVPPATTADVRLPDGQRFTADPGEATYTCTLS